MADDSKDTETQAAIEPRSDPGSAAEPAVDLWAVSYSEADDRELTAEEVTRAFQRGEINGTTLVWHPGMDDWQPLSRTPDFAPLLAERPPAETAAAAPKSDAPTPTPVEAPDPVADPPVSAPSVPSPSSAPRSASAPPPASAPPSAPAPPPASAPSVPSLPSAPSAPSAPPPAPSAPSAPSPAPSAPDLDDLDQDFRPHRERYVLAGAALVAAIVAGLVWWSADGSSEDAASFGSARANAELAPAPSATPVPHGTPAAALPSETGSASRPGPQDADLPPFNRMAALKIMGVAAYKAIRCRGRGTPAGIARVTVTFEPSGAMSSARIYQAPYAGTPTATCILKKLGKPSVAPFKGPAVTMRISVELH